MAKLIAKKCAVLMPALEVMEKHKLFNKSETKTMVQTFKDYERKLQSDPMNKDYYVKYVQYLIEILRQLKERRERYGIHQQKRHIEFVIADKVVTLYTEAIHKFQDDLRFWSSYIAFCRSVRLHTNVHRILGRMIQIHKEQPKCWHIAAQWELEENNREGALKYLTQGLLCHPASQLLYLDALKLELENALSQVSDSVANNSKDEKTKDNSKDDIKSPDFTRVMNLYERAYEHIKDIKFIIDVINFFEKYSEAKKLEQRVVGDLVQDYSENILMWDTMAKREYRGAIRPLSAPEEEEADNSKFSYRERIEACNDVYLSAIKLVKSKEMWVYYVEFMMEINEDRRELPNLKRKLLRSALNQAHHHRALQEKHYIYWIKMLRLDEGEKLKLREIINSATDIIPDSYHLWDTKIKYLLSRDLIAEATNTLLKASLVIPEKVAELWKVRILYEQSLHSEGTEELFKQVVELGIPCICKEIDPLYLEWIILNKTIEYAREVYQKLCSLPTASLELHKKMIELETIQPEVSLNEARVPHEICIHVYGKTNIKVWLDYISFEMNYGDPELLEDIHSRARSTLVQSELEKFFTEYSIIKISHKFKTSLN